MYGKMPGKSNFFSKGLSYIKKRYILNLYRFAMVVERSRNKAKMFRFSNTCLTARQAERMSLHFFCKFIQSKYNKIKFALFGTSLALPSLLFNNCKGSCSSCYGCLISGTPLLILITLLIYRKISSLRYLKSKPLKP